jgi:polyhydroxybutyrate depolymerase
MYPMKNEFLLLIVVVSLIVGCKKDPTPDYDLGKNRFTTDVNGDLREYYVHVPDNYDPDVATPVVFMLHGSSGDGLKFYNISGWTDVGDAENILTVYPSSWSYCTTDNGSTTNITQWNVFPGSFTYCTGETPRDDVKFMRQILADMGEVFTLDESRIYMVGFSAGSQMATRCAVEMSDLLAAVVASTGSFTSDTLVTPLRQIPLWYLIGNKDDGLLTSSTTNIPMRDFELFINVSAYGSKVVHSNIHSFGCDSAYTVSGDSNLALTATYPGLSSSPPHEFRFTLVKDLEHEYPNGTNHAMFGAREHWAWLRQYVR